MLGGAGYRPLGVGVTVGEGVGHLDQPPQAVVDGRLGELHVRGQLGEVELGVLAARPTHVLQRRRETGQQPALSSFSMAATWRSAEPMVLSMLAVSKLRRRLTWPLTSRTTRTFSNSITAREAPISDSTRTIPS